MGKMTKEELNRLDRIEEKIDKLSDAIVLLARAEEKIHNLQERLTVTLSKLNDFDDRVRSVEALASDNEQKLTAMTKFLWIIITGVVGTVTTSIAILSGK
jgi:chromosome segregation ATPase